MIFCDVPHVFKNIANGLRTYKHIIIPPAIVQQFSLTSNIVDTTDLWCSGLKRSLTDSYYSGSNHEAGTKEILSTNFAVKIFTVKF